MTDEKQGGHSAVGCFAVCDRAPNRSDRRFGRQARLPAGTVSPTVDRQFWRESDCVVIFSVPV